MPNAYLTRAGLHSLIACVFALLLLVLSRSGLADPGLPYISGDSLRESVSLRGQWRFQPGDDPAWAAVGLDDSEWGERGVPARWPPGGYPEQGQMAWYRLTLQLDPALRQGGQLDQLAVRMGKVLSAYELYAGGQLIGGVGSLPPLAEVTYDRERVFTIPAAAVAADGQLVLALRVWGGEATLVNAWSVGPTSGEFKLGPYRDLLLAGFVGEAPGMLLCVLIFAFGCYHLYLYGRNRRLDSYLWFGLLAINIAICGLMSSQWKYLSDLSFLSMKKIEFAVIYLVPAIGIQALWTLLQLPIPRWLRVYQISFLLAAAAVLLVPGHGIHYYTLTPWQYGTLPLMLWALWVTFREARRGNAEARTVLVAAVLFIAAGVNDLLIDLVHLETPRLTPIGFGAILVAMAVSLANRFTLMSNELEDEVAQRTAELNEANRQLARAARVDHLTGLLNRRGFTEEANTEIRRMFRSGNGFAVVLADVDKFKQFNDQHGHVCGDHVLRRVADILRNRTRDVDRVARWGGEEFIFLLPETGAEGAAQLAEKLREHVACNRFEFGEKRLAITMTFGVAAFRKGESLDSCIARADTALYCGKERGRNRVMIGNYKGLSLVN